MAKHKGRQDSAETHDREALRQVVVRIRELLAPAIRLAGEPDDPDSKGTMEAGHVDRLTIDYWASVECAMRDLTRWGKACEEAWNEKLVELGQFKAKPPKVAGKAR